MALSNIMTGALLSADTSRQIANVQHAVRKQMDGHAGKIWKLRELKRLPKRKKQRKLPGRRKPKKIICTPYDKDNTYSREYAILNKRGYYRIKDN